MTTAVLDLDAAWNAHVADVLAERDDAKEIHGSDLHSCAFALQQRLRGVEQLPHDDGSFANFERGHAYETRLDTAIKSFVRDHKYVTHGETVEYRGIIGNLDWVLYDGQFTEPTVLATIDLSTTAASTPDWKYGHALKSAFYAVAKGAPRFCEWVFCIGFGGKIVAQQAHWFSLSDEFEGITWRDRVDMAIDNVYAVSRQVAPIDPQPPFDPKDGALETWRCGKVTKTGKNAGKGSSYCRAQCPLNAAYDAGNAPL